MAVANRTTAAPSMDTAKTRAVSRNPLTDSWNPLTNWTTFVDFGEVLLKRPKVVKTRMRKYMDERPAAAKGSSQLAFTSLKLGSSKVEGG